MEKKHLDFVDNLRWVVILLVVGQHAAVTYSHIGSWYYKAPEAPDRLATVFFLIFQVHLQAFFMGFMFLLAGYFVPAAYDRKGFCRFLKDRFLRLGLPSLLYIFAIHPLQGYFLLGWWKQSLGAAYWQYLISGRWLSGSGPMWFAIALLLFSCVYAMVRALTPDGGSSAKFHPSQRSALLAIGMTISFCAYLIRVYFPIGGSIFNMQICFFSQYIIMFIVGILSFRGSFLQSLSWKLGRRLFVGTLILSPLCWFCLLFPMHDIEHELTPFLGSGTWQSAVFALWESMFCVAVSAGMLTLFREKFDYKSTVANLLTDSSFGLYVFHPPVLIAVSLALAPVSLSPVTKFAVVWPSAVAGTALLVHFLLRRTPFLKRIL